jgi:hypothetical protein
MSDQIKEELKKFHHEIDFKGLVPYFAQGILRIVEDIDLFDAGVAIAQDQVQTIKNWMDSNQLRELTTKEVELWNEDCSLRFEFIIVQPFVICKKL